MRNSTKNLHFKDLQIIKKNVVRGTSSHIFSAHRAESTIFPPGTKTGMWHFRPRWEENWPAHIWCLPPLPSGRVTIYTSCGLSNFFPPCVIYYFSFFIRSYNRRERPFWSWDTVLTTTEKMDEQWLLMIITNIKFLRVPTNFSEEKNYSRMSFYFLKIFCDFQILETLQRIIRF